MIMIVFDILKLRSLLKGFRSVFTFLILIARGNISASVTFQAYPKIVSRGRILIGDNVWIGKNVSFKISSNGELNIGDGVVISDNCHFSVRENGRIAIGKRVRINSGAIVSGDVEIEANAIVAPNVVMISDSHRIAMEGLTIDDADAAYGMKLGTIVIREHAFIGVGAVILHNVKVGRESVVGAQALVLRDVGDKEVIVSAGAVNKTKRK